MRSLLLVLSLAIGLVACTDEHSQMPTAYRTDGTAKLEVCKGAGIEKCVDEPKDIPNLIDLRNPRWRGIRSERKSSILTMCYLDQPAGLFTKRKLRFKCEPIYDQLPNVKANESQDLQDSLERNLANMAEAAAMFQICASDKGLDAEASLKWTGYSLALADIADGLSQHFGHDELFLAYEMLQAKLYSSDEFKSETIKQMENCNAQSLRDADQYVHESRDIEAQYLAR